MLFSSIYLLNSDMISGITKGLLKFAVPVILGNLFQLFYTLADSVIVGKTLGADSDLLSAGSPDSQMDADPG